MSSPARGGLGRLVRRLLGGSDVPHDPPLADRPLAVPPRGLELEVGAVRERGWGDAAPPRSEGRRRLDEPDDRPLWVRRLEEWAPEPRRPAERPRSSDAPVAFDDGWDPPSAGSQPDSR